MTILHEPEKCPICGNQNVGEPEHIVDMAALVRDLDAEPSAKLFAWHGFKDASGHRWRSKWVVP